MKRFLKSQDGVAAIEFAFTAPILIFTALGGIVIGTALWQWNSLQSVARATARCVALNSTRCESVPAGCSSGDAGICYALAQAQQFSLDSRINVSDIVIDRAATINGMSVTTVSIRQPFGLLAASFMLTAKASYPNISYTPPPPPPPPPLVS